MTTTNSSISSTSSSTLSSQDQHNTSSSSFIASDTAVASSYNLRSSTMMPLHNRATASARSSSSGGDHNNHRGTPPRVPQVQQQQQQDLELVHQNPQNQQQHSTGNNDNYNHHNQNHTTAHNTAHNYGSYESYPADEDMDEFELDNNYSYYSMEDDHDEGDYDNVFDDIEEEEVDDERGHLLPMHHTKQNYSKHDKSRDNRHQTLLAQISLLRKDYVSSTTTNSTERQHNHNSPTLSQFSNQYNWKLYAPSPTHHFVEFLRWTMVGGSQFTKEQSDQELHLSLQGLAQCLQLLRDYLQHYGMPARGCYRDQEHVLREVMRDLYAGGAPLWALEPVLQKAAEGLMGHPNVNWQLLPRKALIYNPASGTTSMFKMDRGFNIRKMSNMEGVAVRLASFASNVQGVANIPARFPNPQEFQRAAATTTTGTATTSTAHPQHVPENSTPAQRPPMERIKMARKILNLASKQQGLFYYINSREYMGNERMMMRRHNDDDDDNENDQEGDNNVQEHQPQGHDDPQNQKEPPPPKHPHNHPYHHHHHGVDDFWVVSDEERELFSRLACMEALKAIDSIDARENDPTRPTIYTPTNILLCRGIAAASACAFWFGGSWMDSVVAGILAVVVAIIGTSSLLSKQERLVYEVVASLIVGLTSGLLAMTWPNQMCFSAMAISGVIDLLQGFRVVYAIIEIMSRHTVCGGADLLEGILFTGLITYFLQFGSYIASSIILKQPHGADFAKCTNPVHEAWYIVLVPAGIISWSFMFTPNPRDLPGMVFHGMLGYCTNLGLSKIGFANEPNYFISASAVSLSAGIYSRFTGRQAVGNTITGLYTLLPGAYLVSALYEGPSSSFITDIVQIAVILGIGGWTGTILCSPTLLGTTRGLLWQSPTATTPNQNLRHSTSDPINTNMGRRPPPPRAPMHVRRQSLPVHLDLHNGNGVGGGGGNSNASSVSGMYRRHTNVHQLHPHQIQGHGRKFSMGAVPTPGTSYNSSGTMMHRRLSSRDDGAQHRRHRSKASNGSYSSYDYHHQQHHQQQHPFHQHQQHHPRHNRGASGDTAGGHNRNESNVSVFDFDHPTSTMLFF